MPTAYMLYNAATAEDAVGSNAINPSREAAASTSFLGVEL